MLKSALRNFLVQLLALGVSLFDRLVVVALLIRSFGVDQYADWVTLSSAAGLLNLAETGLNFYFGNRLQNAFARRDDASFQRALGIALGAAGALSLCLFALAALAFALVDIDAALTLRAVTGREARLCLALLAALAILRILRGCLLQIYRGRQEFSRGIVVDALTLAAVALASALVSLSGGGPAALAIVCFGVDMAVGWGVALIDIRRRYPLLRLVPATPTRAEIADVLRCVKWAALAQISVSLLQWLPALILGATAFGARAIVAFVVLRTLVNVARQATGMLLLAVNVELAATLPDAPRAAIAARLRELAAVTLAAASAVGVALLAYGVEALAFWTGRGGLFDLPTLCWMLAGLLAGTLAAPVQMLLSFANEPRFVALAGLINVLIGVPLGAAAAASCGAAGLAFGLALGEIAASLFLLTARLPQRLETSLSDYALWPLALAALTALWCAATAAAIGGLVSAAGVFGFGLRLAAFGLFGAVPALALAIPPALRASLLARARRIVSRAG